MKNTCDRPLNPNRNVRYHFKHTFYSYEILFELFGLSQFIQFKFYSSFHVSISRDHETEWCHIFICLGCPNSQLMTLRQRQCRNIGFVQRNRKWTAHSRCVPVLSSVIWQTHQNPPPQNVNTLLSSSFSSLFVIVLSFILIRHTFSAGKTQNINVASPCSECASVLSTGTAQIR